MKKLLQKIYHKVITCPIFCYIFMLLLISLACQIFTDAVLSKYELFWTAHYDDLLINLFTVQITIIILPLSFFGIFTETINEIYLGQPIAKYMYLYKYQNPFAFNYREVVISSMIAALIEYIFMSKELLAAELIILLLNTAVIIVSLFSWIDMRIHKENLYQFIRDELSKEIENLMKSYSSDPTDTIKASNLLSNLKNWVIDGGDHELEAAMQFYSRLYYKPHLWKLKEYEGYLLRIYENPDDYFNELIAALLRKQDYYRALAFSKHMLKTIAGERKDNLYHLDHYHYHILLRLFNIMDQMQIELLGKEWVPDYLIAILENGNTVSNNSIEEIELDRKAERNQEDLKKVKIEGSAFVYEILISIWKNDNLDTEYKQQTLANFLSLEPSYLSASIKLNIRKSKLCVSLKLMQAKNPDIINIIIKKNWELLASCPPVQECDFYFFEKSLVLILTYCYYLTVYTNQLSFTIPDLYLISLNNRQIQRIFRIRDIIADYIWKWYKEVKVLLGEYQNLDNNFCNEYDELAYEMMLFGILSHDNLYCSIRNKPEGLTEIIHYFRSITYNDEALKALTERYKKYLILFEMDDTINEQSIHTQFYKFKKEILQYYMNPVQKAAETFNKTEFLENLKEKIWEELLKDEQITTGFQNTEEFHMDITDYVEQEQSYFIIPYSKDFDIYTIERFLRNSILRKQREYELAERDTDSSEQKLQSSLRNYHIVFLDCLDMELDKSEIKMYLKKRNGYKVRLNFPFDYNRNIFYMNFETYKEAYAFVKSTYRKIRFRIKLNIES